MADPTKPKNAQQLVYDQLGDTGSDARPDPTGYMLNNPSPDYADTGGSQAAPAYKMPDAGEPGGFAGNQAAAPAAPQTPAAPSWAPGAHAGQNVTLLGFDSSKLDDPNSGSAAGSKYTAAAKAFYGGLKQDVGLSRGGLDNMVNYVRANGFGNAKAVGDDKIDFGDGNGPVDVVRSDGQIVFQNTTGNPVWEQQYPGAGGGARPAPGGGAGGNMDGTFTPSAPSPYAAAPAQNTAVRDSAQQAIMKLLADSQKPVDLNDPNLQLQLQARDRQGQRAQERTRAMLAERAAANGDLTGGHGDGSFESDLNGLEQSRGEDMADFSANLVNQEQGARRQSLVQAIQMAEQSGQFDQAQALQAQLASMDADLRRQQMANQNNQFYAGLSQSGDQFNRQLAQNGYQFDTTMDYNSAGRDADNYYRWVMSGLNG